MSYAWQDGELITAEKLNNTNDTFDIWLWQTGAPGYAWQYIGDHSLTKAHQAWINNPLTIFRLLVFTYNYNGSEPKELYQIVTSYSLTFDEEGGYIQFYPWDVGSDRVTAITLSTTDGISFDSGFLFSTAIQEYLPNMN